MNTFVLLVLLSVIGVWALFAPLALLRQICMTLEDIGGRPRASITRRTSGEDSPRRALSRRRPRRSGRPSTS
jgi:hypothetical protein